MRPPTSAAGVAVVGGGIAGQSVCEQLRDRDPTLPITLICGEPRLPYDRVRLSELLLKDDPVDALALRPAEWYADHGIDVLLDTWVTKIDADTATVTFGDGSKALFEYIVLATGSDALMPPIPGIDLGHVLPFRGPEDCDRVRAAAAPGSKVAVIGGGILGLEAARGALGRGAEVTIVHLVDRLMERQLDPEGAAMLLPSLEQMGIGVLLERSTVKIERNALHFADGKRLETDLVVVSVGIKPQVDLAKAAGLELGRGILVDDTLKTSADKVYAVGECAQHHGVVYGLVAPIHDQARICAAAIAGDREAAYTGSLQWAKLKVAGLDLVTIGASDGDAGAVVADRATGSYRKLVLREGKLVGAILLGDIRGSDDLLAGVRAEQEVLDPLERLADAAAATAADLPMTAQVCDCNGVCKQEIVDAVTVGGCATAREVMATTRAGTGCGSCRATVIELVSIETGGASDEPAFLCPCLKQTRESVAAEIRTRGLKSVSEVSDACGTGRQCGTCKPALAYLVSEINLNEHAEERHAKFINDRVHANIQNDGTFSVVPRMYGGVTTPDELRRIADAADKYGARMVKVTGGQRIDLLGIKKSDLPDIWRDIGMPSGMAYSKAVRTVKSCVGTDFCRFGVGDSIDMAIQMEKAWEGIHTPHKVKCAATGCPRNCAEATVKDIGVVAIEGGWQIRVGGAAGASVREGDILATVKTKEEVLKVATAFLQYYRENAPYLERTYDFVPRVGLETIQAIVNDPEQSAALRERFAIAKAATRDAWLERDEPHHPRQFVDLDGEPVLVGPPSEED